MKGGQVLRSRMMLSVWCVLAVCCSVGAWAQMLTGPWVEQSQQRIDEVRKTSLRVIVMGRDGKPVPGAKVHIQQTRHVFDVGFVLPQAGWPDAESDEVFWRCFNAVSIQRLTSWPALQPDRDAPLNGEQARRVGQALSVADSLDFTVRWGDLVSADPGRLPDWAVGLAGPELANAVLGYQREVLSRFGRSVDQFDAYTQTLAHDHVDRLAGLAVVRRLYESIPAAAADAVACARFDDGLTIGRVQKVQRRLTTMREAFIPVGLVAIDQRFSGPLERPALERTIGRIDQFNRPVVISGLEVGGDSPVSAAINLEMVLRTLMERPNLQGIWFTGLTAEELSEPGAALLDDDGQPTAAGLMVDSLFHGLWWTDLDTQTDELGNVRVRAFPGAFHLSATLHDGTVLRTEIWLVKSDDPRVVLLEPVKQAGKVGGQD